LCEVLLVLDDYHLTAPEGPLCIRCARGPTGTRPRPDSAIGSMSP
jgi:hypothetical protein